MGLPTLFGDLMAILLLYADSSQVFADDTGFPEVSEGSQGYNLESVSGDVECVRGRYAFLDGEVEFAPALKLQLQVI